MLAPDLKKRLAKRELTFGSWITTGSEVVAELMAQQGFDWLVVDLEHSSSELETAARLIRVIQGQGCSALVRVSSNDHHLIKRIMDAGADGVIVPMVCTAEEAARAVSAVRYPPLGTRGVGLARAQGYGYGFEAYRDALAADAIVIVQIEHIRAVEHFEAIMDTDGVDGFIIGPYDLSGSLGKPGDFDAPDVVAALDTIASIAQKRGYLTGFHVIPSDPEALAEKVELGYRFVAHSLDTIFLGDAIQQSTALRARLQGRASHE